MAPGAAALSSVSREVRPQPFLSLAWARILAGGLLALLLAALAPARAGPPAQTRLLRPSGWWSTPGTGS